MIFGQAGAPKKAKAQRVICLLVFFSRWEHQYRVTCDKNDRLSSELQMECKNLLMLRDDYADLQGKEEDARNEAAYLEALVQRYEQRIFDLEEVEVELREKLNLLEQACHVVSWIQMVSRQGKLDLKALPMVIEFSEKDTQTEREPETVQDLESLVKSLESDKLKLKDCLMAMVAEKESLAQSLEGTHEDRIERIIQLEDKIAELIQSAKVSKEEHVREIEELSRRLQAQEKDYTDKIIALEKQSEENKNSNSQGSAEEMEIVVQDQDQLQQSSDDELFASKLKAELADLREKEAAYCQTIQEADSILSKVESDYQVTIQTLEEEKRILAARVASLESSQSSIRADIKTLSRGGEENYKLAELLRRLMDTEQRELELKEKVYRLEKSEREMSLKLLEHRKLHADTKNELHDQETLIQKMYQVEKDYQELSSEISRLKEIERKYQDILQTEGFLHGRVEELEQTETSLRTNLKAVSERDRLWQEKLEHELDKSREASDLVEEERLKKNVLRIEVEGLNSKVSEMQKVIESKTLELDQNESTFRSEVSIPPSSSACSSSDLQRAASKFCLTRYRSIRDHNGRYYLVVKIR